MVLRHILVLVTLFVTRESVLIFGITSERMPSCSMAGSLSVISRMESESFSRLFEGAFISNPRFPSFVLFNRQPSLHKMSMMSHRVRLMPYSSTSDLYFLWRAGC